MTNYDYYINEIMKDIGVDKKTGEIVNCPLNEKFDCKDCIFGDAKCLEKDAKKVWLESEYEPIIETDWSKVKIDTPIYVKANLDDEWIPRYFAKYLNGDVYAWTDGKTSFTTHLKRQWNYAKEKKKKKSATDE